MLSFYPSRRRRLGMASVAFDGMESRRRCVWYHASACISVGLISYATSPQFHTATCCGFHTRLRRDLDAKGEWYGKKFIAWIFRTVSLRDYKALQRAQNRLQYCISGQKILVKCFCQHFRSTISASLADMLSKFGIARKECMGTESWLKLIFSSGSIDEEAFKKYRNLCGRIRRMLTYSCITIENKMKQG